MAGRTDYRFISVSSKFSSTFATVVHAERSAMSAPAGIALPAMAAAYHLDPWDPWQALDGLARYDLDSLRAFWDWSHTIASQFGGNRNAYAWGLALAAYHAAYRSYLERDAQSRGGTSA